MEMNYIVNSLAFRAVLEEQTNFKSIINEIKLESSSGKKCRINFSFKTNLPVYPTGLLLFLEIIRDIKFELPNIILFFDIDPNSYLHKIGFASFIQGHSTITSNHNVGKTNIPITKISKNEINELRRDKGISIGEATEIIISPYAKLISNFDKNLIEPFTHIIREVARNSFEHGNSESIFLCIQHWPNRDQVEIAIADNGIGIFKSLSSNMNYKHFLNNDKEALLFSLKPGVSRTFSKNKKNNSYWDNSGYGLYVAHKLCYKLEGFFTFGSFNSRVTYSSNGLQTSDFDYKGTIVGMIFKYSKLNNYKDIMRIINEEGIVRAKEQKLGFSKPSGSSINKNK